MNFLKKITILSVLLFLLCNCSSQKTDPRKKFLQNAFLLALIYEATKDYSNCRTYSGKPNNLFASNLYKDSFEQDTNFYTNIILGDSSMDLSSRIDGFLSNSSKSFAVSGNTLCDMKEQLTSIQTPSPSWVIIGTLGGNDVLRKYSTSNVIHSGNKLIEDIKTKYPSASIAGIAIHPTRISYANQNKIPIHTALQPLLDCYLQPDSFFTYDTDGLPKEENFFTDDPIHYNSTIAWQIKNSLQTTCGIEL
ncbi:MAG: hypothetical protein AAF518_11180 [Spirochaetota bacterium]